MSNLNYEQFLAEKVKLTHDYGREISDDDIHPILKPHQREIVRWAVKGGRRAIFAAFGLGKSVMQLEAVRLSLPEDGRGLIIAPLGVRGEFRRDAAMLGQQITFIRRTEEVADPGLYITNYESVRDGKLDPSLFDAVSLDEASILRSFGSKTYQTFLTLFDDVPFRFVATATPSPNRYKELIHYAGYLGVMDTGNALTRFFQRDSTKANNLTLYPHKMVEFYLWLHSWAIFLQKPSDLCRCTCHQGQNPSLGSVSESSLPSSGSLEPAAPGAGSVDATAGLPSSRGQAFSKPGGREAVDASDRATTAREAALTPSGAAWSTDALTQITRTGKTTAAEESKSASAGGNRSPHSGKTWEALPSGSPSSGSTITADTSLETADGQPVRTKLEILDALDTSPMEAELNHSPHGRKSSERTTSPSTPDSSNSDGRRSEPSLTSCDHTCDEGYDLPPLTVNWHCITVDQDDVTVDRGGQAHLFRDAAISLKDAAREKRLTMPDRVAKAREIVEAHPEDHFILWHDLEAERHEIKAQIPEAVEVYGSQDLDERERRILGFSDGEYRILATKPIIAGSGCNFQRHCHRAIFVGVGFKFNDFIQAVHRIYRFLQTEEVIIDVIYAESETEVVKTLKEKWVNHKHLTERMSELIQSYGLASTGLESLTRSMGIERKEAHGADWVYANNDTVAEAALMADNSVDLIVTSIPFSNHYEYTPSYNDFGHTDDNAHFWQQMDYLTGHLLRILQPGRIYACHVKDRILFGNVTGAGAPTVSPFHAEAIFHGVKHGFDYMGMITVVTDVVRENNQTYRLGWSEQCKDGTKMGVGSPEYVLLFRKPQTDRSKGYADAPVTKSKVEYSRARWQVDAHAFWRSSGDRHLTPEELAALPIDQRSRLFTDQTLRCVYNHEDHVRTGEILDDMGALPATFMCLAPGSHCPEVWHDVVRMRTLNGQQSARAVANHVCPLQIDIVDRLIRRYSNPGELVYDPFGGLGTVPVRALHLGRRGRGVELNPDYYRDALYYLQAEERKRESPTLFDLEGLSA